MRAEQPATRTLQLKDHDLRQRDADRLRQLGQRQPAELVELSVRLLDDLKEARERLNQNPDNSSVPPSSRPPWSRNEPPTAAAGEQEPPPEPPPAPSPEDAAAAPRQSTQASSPARRPGKPPGAPGHVPRCWPSPRRWTTIRTTACAAPPHSPRTGMCYTGYPVADVTFGAPDHPVLGVISTGLPTTSSRNVVLRFDRQAHAHCSQYGQQGL